MYSPEDRERYFQTVKKYLTDMNDVEGIIQLGSGVVGYKDAYSDIDLMVSSNQNVHNTKNKILKVLQKMEAYYIEEGKFSESIYLLIPFFENGLEMNISVLPTELLSVKSPLWKVLFDRSGKVKDKMDQVNQIFISKKQPYAITDNIAFEFMYRMRKMKIEMKRNNLIYALKMLELLREFTLEVQVINESKKLHQFKAYETLNPIFIEAYLKTYPTAIDKVEITNCSERILELFIETIDKNDTLSIDDLLQKIRLL